MWPSRNASVVSAGNAITKQSSECGRSIAKKWAFCSSPPTITSASPKSACAVPAAWVSGTNISRLRSHLNVKPLQGFIEFANGLVFGDPFIALQPFDLRAGCTRHRIREFRLAASCRSLQQQRFLQLSSQVNGGCCHTVGEITDLGERMMHLLGRLEHPRPPTLGSSVGSRVGAPPSPVKFRRWRSAIKQTKNGLPDAE